MIVELKLEQLIKAGLAMYRDHPRLLEPVFFDLGQVGFPTGLAPGLLVDTDKLWLPDEYAGGLLRYGMVAVPILSNTADTLTLDGDPSATTDPEGYGYQIVPREVAKLTEVLQTQTFTVQTSFAQVPAQLPAFTIRLDRDSQGDTYLGEAMTSYVLDGVEYDANRARLQGQYTISIWSVNRLETLWLYAWLANYLLRSQQMLSTWGLSDVSIGGSDLDPALQFLPERTYARHLILTAQRDEWAVSTQDVEWVSKLELNVIAHYAHFLLTIPAMGR